MNLINFYFSSNNLLTLEFANGLNLLIILDGNSGRIVQRKKVGTLLKIQHTGIYLGKCFYSGERLFIHNHYRLGHASVVTEREYLQNQKISWKEGACSNSWFEVISIGLKHVISKRPYQWLNDNCQILTSTACNNKPYSEDVVKWGGRAIGFALTVLIVKSFTT